MPKTIRLVTFNIAHGRGLSLYQKFSSPERIRKNLRAIGELMVKVDADIVAMQEVDEDSHWNWNINLLKEIQAVAGYEYAELGVNNRRTGKRPLAYGNAILSRHRLEHWHTQSFGEATLGEKGFLYAEIDYQGQVVPLLNAHLDFRSRKRRLEQVESIMDYIIENAHRGPDERPLAPIICGDFNSRSKPQADAVNHLFQHILKHREYHLYPRDKRTFPAHLPSKTIDFVFLPEPYKMTRCEVLPGFLSDHKPVLIEFEL